MFNLGSLDSKVIYNLLEPNNCVRLQVFNKGSIPTQEQKMRGVNPLLNGVAYYDSTINTLYQSWGAPLLAKEFYKPIEQNLEGGEYQLKDMITKEQFDRIVIFLSHLFQN